MLNHLQIHKGDDGFTKQMDQIYLDSSTEEMIVPREADMPIRWQ